MAGVVYRPDEWTEIHAPADANAATKSKAAVAGYIHHVTSITVTLEGAANVAALIFNLRDSTTGAGDVKWTGKLANLANDSKDITLGGLNIPGVIGQAMTLESTAAPAATSSVTVAMTGYTEPGRV